jgi:hypothetical protein
VTTRTPTARAATALKSAGYNGDAGSLVVA